MARYSAAQDARIYKESHLALANFFHRTLERMRGLPEDAELSAHVAERGLSGKEIFGTAYRDTWCRGLLERLEKGEFILVHYAPNKSHRHGATLYLALPKLASLLDNETEYAELLFPTGAGDIPESPDESAEESDEPPPDEEPTSPEAALGWLSEKQALKELTETLVKVDVVILENIAFMRKELTSLSAKVDDLVKVWK